MPLFYSGNHCLPLLQHVGGKENLDMLKKLWTKTKVKSVIKGSQAADGGETVPWDAVILQEDLPETDLTTFHSFVDKFHHHIAGT